jgi:hypothetical protein
MPITMLCPQCGKVATAPDGATGSKGKCAYCHAVIAVPAPGAKLCKLCGVDVSSMKRVKDTVGFYFCSPCYEKAKFAALHKAERKAEPVGAASSPTPPTLADVPDPILLDDDMSLPGIEEDAPPSPAPEAPLPKGLPKECPYCHTPVVKRSIYCVKCCRDMTGADGDGEEELTTAEKAGEWIAKSLKWGLILGVAAGLIFVGWLTVSTLLMPKEPFSEYPITHEQAVKDYFTAVANGDKEGALRLVSFRMKVTNNPKEYLIYNGIADRINRDFTKKYGAGWDKQMKIERDEMPWMAEGDAALAVVIGKDRYIVTVEAQRPLDQAVQTLLYKREDKPHGEDGKNHFGVCEVEDYLAHTREKDEKPKAGPLDIPAIPKGGAHPDGGPLPGDEQ